MKGTSHTPMLPNGDMEIVFSFDTTGSMSCCLETVRQVLQDVLERLFADIPGLKVAIFAHGDYCDARTSYVTKFVNFTNNVQELCKFAENTGPTGGGDADECYELVLHEVRTKLNWTPGTQRALVLIGDANPHEPNYRHYQGKDGLKLDWRHETQKLKEMVSLLLYLSFFISFFYRHIGGGTFFRWVTWHATTTRLRVLKSITARSLGSLKAPYRNHEILDLIPANTGR